MRLVTREKFTITKAELAKALDVPRIDSIELRDSHIKVIMHKGIREIAAYFRCSDLRGLLNLDINLFDENVKLDKKTGSIVYYREVEHLRSSWGLFRLKKKLKELLK